MIHPDLTFGLLALPLFPGFLSRSRDGLRYNSVGNCDFGVRYDGLGCCDGFMSMMLLKSGNLSIGVDFGICLMKRSVSNGVDSTNVEDVMVNVFEKMRLICIGLRTMDQKSSKEQWSVSVVPRSKNGLASPRLTLL